jgi:DNA-binding CsgD family transcriptional regulator
MRTLLGHHAEASAAFDRARVTLEKNGQRPLRAMTDYDEALALIRHGRGTPTADAIERASGLIDAAEAGFAVLGMRGWEASARELRAEMDEVATRAGGRKRATLPAGITARELDILRLVVRGNSDRQIGEDLYLSPRTVNAHIRHMLAKTALSNRTELSVWAVEQGLVER